MDATLLWTVVGSGAGVTGVVVTVGIYAAQARSARRHPPLGEAGHVRVTLEPPAGEDPPAALTVLRAPTGRLPEHVRGRAELLARLRVLTDSPDGRVHLLAGLGGTGKSTVALRTAEEAAQSGRPVWWVAAGDAGTVTTALLGLARELGAPPGEVAEALAGQRNPADLLWRFLEPRPGWLLVFDNADDLAALAVSGAGAGEGTGWIRPAASGLIVVTSRISDPHAWGRHVEVHAVGWLDPATGAQVLADLAPGAGSLEDAAALSERLGGLPLALHHAGSHLASDFAAERTFTDYTQALESRFGHLMGHGAEGDRAIVTSTWELSLDALAARGRPQARPLLRVLSCLAPATLIPPGLLDSAVLGRVCDDGEDGVPDGLEGLSSVGLIATQPAPAGTRPGVAIHPLVAETNRLRLDSEDPERAGGVAVGLLTAASARLRYDSPGDWPAWLELGPHLNAIYGYLASRLADTDLAALARVSAEVALAFVWAGSYPASEELARSALHHATRLGADHEVVLSLRYQVAGAHRFRGEYAEAERELRAVLATRLRVLGPDHPNTLTTRHEIALMLGQRGEHEQAEQEFRAVLDARTRVMGAEHLYTLATHHEIACEMAARGSYAEAEAEYRAVLDARTRVVGAEHPDTLATRYEIARMMAAQGSHAEAEAEYRALLGVETRLMGAEHPDTLATRYEIAWMMAAQGSHAEAEAEYRAVLDARTRVVGTEHPDTLATRYEIARMMAAQGSHAEAEAEYRAVLDAQTRVVGAEHPDTLATRYEIARMMAAQGSHAEAEAEYRVVLDARTRVLGAEHPDTLATRYEIARMMAAQGSHAEAEAEYRAVLDARTRVLGAEHPSTQRTAQSLDGLHGNGDKGQEGRL